MARSAPRPSAPARGKSAGKSSGKRAAGAATPATGASPGAGSGYRAKVRMYRHGLGDCFLVTLPRKVGGEFFILIDCGVILGTADPAPLMTKVVEDVVARTGGKVDLLLATHAHWDHVSGFVQVPEAFAKLKADKVWMAWSENPEDDLAKKLAHERKNALAALRLSASRLHLAGDEAGGDAVGDLLGFFGAAKGKSTDDAMAAVRAMGNPPRYCRPDDPPVDLPDVGARLYILGPPRDEKMIKKTLPSKRAPETYGLAADGPFMRNMDPVLGTDVPEVPFGALAAIPLRVAQEMPFFRERYFADEAWRRVDTVWLDGSTELALQLDSATNNTSLVLAIELENGDVLLFAADAQVGNWLSWQDVKWQVAGRDVTGPDLLRRTILYKVGHHGSHNATLRDKGLELMDGLRLAMIPVVEAMAKKKHWGRMPLGDLVAALEKKAKGVVIRSDVDLPAGTPGIAATPLYYEVTV
jgi:hypothetical protein